MSKKRFDVLVPSPAGSWVPGTLVLDTESSRADTLKATVHGTRGEGEVLFRAESFSEKLGGLGALPPPRGFQLLSIVLDPSGRSYELATVLGDEIVQGARILRRGKPKTPIPKGANDEIRMCVACGMRVMFRGGEHSGWKGIQMHPDVLTYDYYCIKPACVEKRDEAIERAKVNWGYAPAEPEPIVMRDEEPPASTAGATPVPRGAAVEGERPVKSPYGPPPDKPFL